MLELWGCVKRGSAHRFVTLALLFAEREGVEILASAVDMSADMAGGLARESMVEA